MSIRYVFEDVIAAVREEKQRVYVSGIGDKTVFQEVSLGWWVKFRGGSPASLYLGTERPAVMVDDRVRFTMEVIK